MQQQLTGAKATAAAAAVPQRHGRRQEFFSGEGAGVQQQLTGAIATAAAAAPKQQGCRQDSFIGGSKGAAAVDRGQSHSSSSSASAAGS